MEGIKAVRKIVSVRSYEALSDQQYRAVQSDIRLIGWFRLIEGVFLSTGIVWGVLIVFYTLSKKAWSAADYSTITRAVSLSTPYCMTVIAAGFGLYTILLIPLVRRLRAVQSKANTAGINMLLHGTNNHFHAMRRNPPKYVFLGARDSLVQVLPDLQSADTDIITARSHRILHQCLREEDSELSLRVLGALPHVGTQSALRHVEALANGEYKLGSNAHVHQAAIICLGLLKEHMAEQNTNTLLRASAPAPSPGELLRAADSTHSNPEADTQLLRPTLGQEETPVR